VVALDADGRPSFQRLQNYASTSAPLLYFVFDVMILGGRDVTGEPLAIRRGLLETKVLPKLAEPVRYVGLLDAPLPTLIQSVKADGLEGLVAKRLDSRYEPGVRSGAWLKMRVNRGQEFVIGGYTVGNPFDALIFGYYQDGKLLYAARTRNGFTPATRAQLARRFKGLEIKDCPFANLPEQKGQPAGTEGGALGRGADGEEDGGLPLAETSRRGPVRVRRVDGRRPPASHEVRRPPRRQGPEDRRSRMTPTRCRVDRSRAAARSRDHRARSV
jgi:ATP-dependent DNA ligase